MLCARGGLIGYEAQDLRNMGSLHNMAPLTSYVECATPLFPIKGYVCKVSISVTNKKSDFPITRCSGKKESGGRSRDERSGGSGVG